MKIRQLVMMTAGGSALLANASAHAVITGLTLVPVSFEQGWLDETGAVISTGSGATSVSQDAMTHARVIKAWEATNNAYCTVRMYIQTDTLTTGVNGVSGLDIDPHFRLRVRTTRPDLVTPGEGFFNYSSMADHGEAGPQPFLTVNVNQGQRAFDSYFTAGGADEESDAGRAIEGDPTMFDALRGVSHIISDLATGQTGGLGGAQEVDCENCGYFSSVPVLPKQYSYSTAASLAANGGLPITGQGLMVGQFTIRRTNAMFAQALTVGSGTTIDENFYFQVFIPACEVPAPSAAAALVAGGLFAGGRRRRCS